MSGQHEHPLDNMNETLLSGNPFIYNDYEIRLNTHRVYEVYKNGEQVKRVPANWSTYFEIEDMLMKE